MVLKCAILNKLGLPKEEHEYGLFAVSNALFYSNLTKRVAEISVALRYHYFSMKKMVAQW